MDEAAALYAVRAALLTPERPLITPVLIFLMVSGFFTFRMIYGVLDMIKYNEQTKVIKLLKYFFQATFVYFF